MNLCSTGKTVATDNTFGLDTPRLNFQNDKGKAKPYQVRQLFKIIDDFHREDA
jgi:hypothetical protein